MTLTTTPAALLLIKAFEGFEPDTYFDSVGIPTIGFGTTKFANGEIPQLGDSISEDEAEAELFHYVRSSVEPTMNQHFDGVPLQPNQRDALASFLYNLGGDSKKWPTLKKLITKQADSEQIADQFMKYRKAGGKVLLGLHRRRMAEALVWMGLAWDRATELAQGASLESNWRDFMPKHVQSPAVDAEIFEELEIPKRGAQSVTKDMSDPTPDTAMTMDDRQYLSAKAVGFDGTYADFMGHRTVVTTRNAIEAPKIDVKKPPKPMEDSKTHRGLAKKAAGKEGRDVGAILAGAGSMAGAMNSLSKNTAQTVENTSPLVAGFTLNHIIIIAMTLGLGLLGYGLWRMYRGEMIAREGRQDGTQLKV